MRIPIDGESVVWGVRVIGELKIDTAYLCQTDVQAGNLAHAHALQHPDDRVEVIEVHLNTTSAPSLR